MFYIKEVVSVQSDFKTSAMSVSFTTIVVNIILSAIKAIAGIVSKSSAMVSDALHSMSDVLSTFIVIIGIKASSKASDKKHPYGHERIECIVSIILSALLFMTGSIIGINALESIFTKSYTNVSKTGAIALLAAVLSIITKEWMYWYTRRTAKKINSCSLMADAWHHRSDAISSVGALIGIGLSMAGFPVFDPIAGIVICVFIIKASLDIFVDASKKIIDTSCDEETEKHIIETVKSIDGVLDVNKLRTRLFGSRIYVDIEIAADGNLSLTNAHEISHKVHDTIEEKFPRIKHCMVHVNPYTK